MTALLDLMGHKREAHKLRIGHRQWDEANSAKNDLMLWFRWGAGRGAECAGRGARVRWEGAVGRMRPKAPITGTASCLVQVGGSEGGGECRESR